jgi:hypothetical protein
MKAKTLSIMLLSAALLAFAPGQAAWADKDGGHMCKSCQMKGKGGGHEADSIKDKFFRKAHFYLDKKAELGLTEEQVSKIENLKLSLKKDLIRNEADVEVLALDIKAKLMEDKVNASDVNGLIDKKYDLKKDAAKKTVSAFAELKTVLTDDQKTKAKGLWGAMDKGGEHKHDKHDKKK